MMQPGDMLMPEERQAIDTLLSLRQSEGASGGQQIDRDWLAMDENLSSYMLYYFPTRFWQWEQVNDEFFNFIQDTRKGVVLMPGQHGKTTMLQRWIIRVMCVEPNICIGYTEKNEPTAFKRGQAILQELQMNKRLQAHYGHFKPRDSLFPWAMGAFTINQRTELIDSPTFSAFGAGGGSILGWRFNILINDDPVTVENSESEQERNKLVAWFNQAAKTCPTPLPVQNEKYLVKHVLVGTPFRMDDLYHTVIEGDEYDFLHLQAVLDEATGLTLSPRYAYEDPVVLAEQAEHDPAAAKLQQEIADSKRLNLYTFKYGTDGGTTAYYRRYQCTPLDEEAQEFKPEFFTGDDDHRGCFDEELTYGAYVPEMVTVTALDPQSGSKSKSSARCGLVTLGALASKPDEWIVLDIEYGKWKQSSADPEQKTQLRQLIRAMLRFQSFGVIEDNAAQAGLIDQTMIEAQRRGEYVRRPMPHHTGLNKHEPDVGIPSLLPIFELGAVRIPYKTKQDRAKSDELMKEFTMIDVYPYTDIMMAFWMSAYWLRKRIKARKRASKPQSDLPIYINRQSDIHYPRHWTAEQKAAYEGRPYGEDAELAELEAAL